MILVVKGRRNEVPVNGVGYRPMGQEHVRQVRIAPVGVVNVKPVMLGGEERVIIWRLLYRTLRRNILREERSIFTYPETATP